MSDKPTPQQRIRELEDHIRNIGAKVPRPGRVEHGPDYIPFGSARHAAFLGLMEAEKDYDGPSPVLEGWRLADPFTWAQATGFSDKYLVEILRQKVSVLTSPIPEVQSDDPLAPNFAPVMWEPGLQLRDITEKDAKGKRRPPGGIAYLRE